MWMIGWGRFRYSLQVLKTITSSTTCPMTYVIIILTNINTIFLIVSLLFLLFFFLRVKISEEKKYSLFYSLMSQEKSSLLLITRGQGRGLEQGNRFLLSWKLTNMPTCTKIRKFSWLCHLPPNAVHTQVLWPGLFGNLVFFVTLRSIFGYNKSILCVYRRRSKMYLWG